MTGKKDRIAIREEPGAVHIVIPAKKDWLLIGFVILWLGGGSFGIVQFIMQMIADHAPAAMYISLAVVWSLLDVIFIVSAVFTLTGSEEAMLRDGMLTLSKKALGIGRTKRYQVANITSLHAEAKRSVRNPKDTDRRLRLDSLGLSGGSVKLGYEGKINAFGIRLEKNEAQLIVDALRSKGVLSPKQPLRSSR
jgi:hypothetical protein